MSKRDMILISATLTWCIFWGGILLVKIGH
jgi:hypothetical protein